jgi:hypothetical protein
VENLPIEPPLRLIPSRLVRLAKPRYVEEGVQYCKCLRDHYKICKNWKGCKAMGKPGPSWVLQRLDLDVTNKSTMQDIHQMSTTSTALFRVL